MDDFKEVLKVGAACALGFYLFGPWGVVMVGTVMAMKGITG